MSFHTDSSTDSGEDITYLPVDVISLKSCTRDDFVETYLLAGVPCIVEDLVSDWPAYHKWSKEYFNTILGQTPIYYHQLNDEDPYLNWGRGIRRTHLSDFITRIDRGERIQHFGLAHPLYDFVSIHPDLVRDARPQTIERFLPGSRFFGLGRSDSRFWPWVPPYPPQMYIAGTGSLSAGHYDPDLSHTFHWCIWGKKSVKLFRYDPQRDSCMSQLSRIDISKPLNPAYYSKFPDLRGLKGWSTFVMPGQTLVIPSRMWHFFKYEEVSMSYVVRGRSFDSLESYCDFAKGVQSPTKTIRFYAPLWRMVDFRQRTFLGNLMAIFESPTILFTRLVLKIISLCVCAQRCMRRVWEWLIR